MKRQLLVAQVALMGLLASTAGAAEPNAYLDELAKADELEKAGEHEKAVDGYTEILQNAPQKGVRPSDFDGIADRYCTAAHGLAEQSIAAHGQKPAERAARLIAVRAKLAHCPKELPVIARLGDALEAAATEGWEADVAPLETRGDVLAAWLAAGAWMEGLESERGLWKRYDALTARLRERFDAAATSAGGARPFSAWLYATLANRLGNAATPPARPSSDWSFTLVSADAKVGENVAPECASLRGAAAAQGVSPKGPNPLKATITLTGCTPSAADTPDKGYDVKMVTSPVPVTRQECHEESVPVLQTTTQTACNQYGENCYSFLVGKYVGEPRTVCADVTEMVSQLHEEKVAYDAIRPGMSVTVGYSLAIELNGTVSTASSSASFRAQSADVVRAPADEAQLAAARPGPNAALAQASTGMTSAVGASIRDEATRRMSRERALAATRAEAAGDTDGAREAWLAIATGPSPDESRQAWERVARGEGCAADGMMTLIDGKASKRSPSPLLVSPWLYDRRRINIESAQAVIRFGVPPMSTRAMLQYAGFESIPSQPDRAAVFTSAMASISPSLYFREDGFGFGYHDTIDIGLMIGVRVSETYEYAGATKVGEESESRFAIGYLVAYTGLLGYRGERIGLFGGARAQYTGLRLGDARTAGGAVPLVGRLELRFAEDMPMILEGWALDVAEPGETPRSLGGSAEIPLVPSVALYGRFERRHLETQFGGLNKDDLVTAGHRDVTVAALGVSMSMQ